MNKSYQWKLLLLVLLVALSIYALLPTFQLYGRPEAERNDPRDPVQRELRGKALKLGLDLRGGMHLALELDKSKLPSDASVRDAVDRAMEILRNRIDQFGVAEPLIQRQGEDRILVQLPGLLDKHRAVQLIGQTAQLEFKLVKQASESRQVIDRINRALAGRSADLPDSLLADSLMVANPVTDLLFDYPDMSRFGGVRVLENDYLKLRALLESVNVDSLIPRDASIGFSAQPEIFDQGQTGRVLYVLSRRAEMTGEAVSNAIMRFGLDPRAPNTPGVSMTLTNKGANLFRKITGANIGRQLAIVLDDKVASAPVIRDRIPTGQAQITGTFTDAEAKDLAIILRAGALPAPVKVVEERTVGPSLGHDSVAGGMRAGIVGALVVIAFMLFYYRGSGLVAIICMALNVFFLFAGLAALRGTLTMPGIAGIVLTVGMAMDASILIFERIREELRAGKTVRLAIDNGFDRAWRTILDANLTTLISAIVLFRFGTGPIKGFAITLGIGLIANIYTAVFVARMIFGALLARRNVRSLSI
ncbi:MAG: protein translocase subunit SecD [Candidatus Eisenbacteria bacterium]|nr:protein translocase subunit SecD [Candidatus Eisenbacteria bacterium]